MRCRALCRELVSAWKSSRAHIGGLRRTGKTAFSLRQLAVKHLVSVFVLLQLLLRAFQFGITFFGPVKIYAQNYLQAPTE